MPDQVIDEFRNVAPNGLEKQRVTFSVDGIDVHAALDQSNGVGASP